MAKHTDWIEELYTRLANEEDARVCKAISDEACREVPGNFFKYLTSNSLTKVGDRLANPKTTLAWLLEALGAPTFFTGIIVPLRESGSLIPQIAIAGFIRSLPVRKWVWVAGSLLQALFVAGIGFAALNLRGVAAGWTLIGLLAGFSLARGLCSVAAKDVLGKTIPKSRRGRLKGLVASISGMVAIVAGASFIYEAQRGGGGEESVSLYAVYLFAGAALWVLAALSFATIAEFDGETGGGANALSEALEQLSLLKEDPEFSRFVIVRALAIGSGLSAPYIIVLAHDNLGGSALWLGIFIIADGLAAMLAAPMLGRWADRSSKGLLRACMLAACLLLSALVALSLTGLAAVTGIILFPVFFFLTGIIHSGVRLGRKTYLVDMAEGNKRTAYVAVSNTVIGVLLLLAGVLTGGLALLSVEAALVFFAACAITGWWLGRQLPDVSAS